MFVKLESENGAHVYVNPAHVDSLVTSAATGFVILSTSRREYVIKGTPEEVHAALFPGKAAGLPAFIHNDPAMHEVLKRVSWANPGDVLSLQTIILARKALGREVE